MAGGRRPECVDGCRGVATRRPGVRRLRPGPVRSRLLPGYDAPLFKEVSQQAGVFTQSLHRDGLVIAVTGHCDDTIRGIFRSSVGKDHL